MFRVCRLSVGEAGASVPASRRILSALFVPALLFGIAPSVGAATYLELLKEELSHGGGTVDRSTVDPDAQVQANPITDYSQASQGQFEERLSTRHGSTFVLYSKLNTEQKAQVLQQYRRNGDFEQVTRMVLKLLYGI